MTVHTGRSICRIFVEPRLQRRGIASLLLDEAEAQIMRMASSSHTTDTWHTPSALGEAGEAFLFAVDGNDTAFRFYESRGAWHDALHGAFVCAMVYVVCLGRMLRMLYSVVVLQVGCARPALPCRTKRK
jgi:hypothetical protein